MKLLQPQLVQFNPAVATAFLRRIGALTWQLMAGGAMRQFSERTAGRAMAWAAEQQQAGRPVFTVLPMLEDGHWWLAARLPLSASPAALKPAPQAVVVADDFMALWRLAEPVTAARARELVSAIIGKAGKPAIGEPVPVPGGVLARQQGAGLVQRFPVRVLPFSPSPGYRIVADRLVDVRAAPAEKHDPRLMTAPLGEGASWQPGAQSNGFLLVLGASGSGKTESLKKVAAGIQRYGVPVLTLDFHGDIALKGIETTLLSSGPASTVGINPLELDMAAAKEAGLYDQRAGLREMFGRAVPSLGHRQGSVLHEALEETYRRAGIADDDPDSWSRQPPTFADLLKVLTEMSDDGRRNADGVIDGVRDLFGHPVFNRAQHLSIEAMLGKSMRLDLSKLPDSVRFILAETLLKRVFRALQMRGAIPVAPVDDAERFRLFVMVDEARILTAGGSRTLDEIFTQARKFGLGMVLASQLAEHFSEDVRSNAATWLVLRPQAMAEAKRNAPNIGVEPEELMRLRGRGDGYFRHGAVAARRIQVQPVG